MHIIIKKKYLTFNNYRIKCAIGKRGIGKKKKEGDLITPIGLFKIRFLLYRKDRNIRLITNLKKYVIKRNMGWCDDPKTKKYNKLITTPFKYSYEKLYKKENIYDLILVLNYNMNPVKKNRGSAIFIHIAKNNYSNTAGCIAIKKNHFLKILKDIKSDTSVKIV
jgi:L,D-peptidoglycan transpeptidase YkuD (ErfK/YbiS/YcfS/YnhG family)